MTALGGAVAVPSAVRRSDSTTTMRVNDVIMIRIDGASDSTVMKAISWITRSVSPRALAEIDADILRGRRSDRRCKDRPYTGRHRRQTDAAADRRCCQVLVLGRPSKLAISCSRLS